MKDSRHTDVSGSSVSEENEDLRSESVSARDALQVASGAGLFDLSGWAKIRLSGPDRQSFLHGLVTNEVKNLPPGQGNYCLILTPQGKVVSDLWVLNRAEDLLVLCPADPGRTVFLLLDKYLIMEEVVLEDCTEAWALFSLQGPRSEEILSSLLSSGSLPAEEYAHVEVTVGGIPATVLKVSHTGETGFDLLSAREHGSELRAVLLQAGAQPAGLPALEILRVEAGIPVVGKELDPTVIPQEAGLHRALSFTKGCYVGQEVVARLHFRGHVNRELTGFLLEGDDVPTETVNLIQDGKTVGKITSAVRSPRLDRVIGLGYLRSALREPGTEVAGEGQGRQWKAAVASLPLVGPGNG